MSAIFFRKSFYVEDIDFFEINIVDISTNSPGSHCSPVYISQGMANETRYD